MDHSLNAIAKKGLSVLDMESILTRAIYQVLNRNPSQSDIYNHLEKNTNNIPADFQNQLKLIAEHLCKRVERIYEKKMYDRREADRNETDKRIKEIRNEYEDEMKVFKRRVEKEKNLLEQALRNRERDMQQRNDIRLMDRENELEIRRKFLENRANELNLVKEQLESASEGFKKKMKGELEAIRIEWEKISAVKLELGDPSGSLPCVQVPIFKERIIELEKICEELKNKLSSREAETFVLKQKLEMKGDSNHYSQFSKDIERLTHENVRLKNEISKYRSMYEGSNNDLQKNVMQSRLNGEALQFKINEQKIIMGLLNDKIKTLTIERDNLRKDIISNSRSQCYDGKHKKGKRYSFSMNLDSENTSEPSTSRSGDSNEIENIRKRIHNLDVIAKELDVSVEHYTSLRAHIVGSHQSLLLSNDGYDDYCRHSSSQNSPKKGNFQLTDTTVLPSVSGVDVALPIIPGSSKVHEEHNDMIGESSQTKPSSNRVTVTKTVFNSHAQEKENSVSIQPAVEDSYYSGIDPVMAQYMRIVGDKRNKDQNNPGGNEQMSSTTPAPAQVAARDVEEETLETVEVTSGLANLTEYNYAEDNDIDW